MSKGNQKKYSLTQYIVGLIVFLDALFLIIIVAVGLFVFSMNTNELKEESALSESQAIVNAVEHTFSEINHHLGAMAQSNDVINYLNYINQGNNPIITEADPNRSLYDDVILLMGGMHQSHQIYHRVFLATDSGCDISDDGCLIDQQGNVYQQDGTWVMSDFPWYQSIQNQDNVLSRPYQDPLSDQNYITYVQSIVSNQEVIGYFGVSVQLQSLASEINSLVEDNDNEIMILSKNQDQSYLMYLTDPIYEEYLYQDIGQFSNIDQDNNLGDEGLSTIINLRSDDINDIDVLNHSYYTSYYDVDAFGLEVIVMIYDSQSLSIEVILILSFIGVGILITFIGYILKGSIQRSLQPIHTIIQSIEEIKNGNYQVKVQVKENNEIKEIGDAINIMSEEIDRQVKLIYDNFAYDQLTGLKNKSAVTQELNQTLFKGDQKTAVCLLQVDNLKDIIIIKGQMMGDSLIKAIAEEIDSLISDKEMLFSFSANELVYIIPNFTNLSQVRDKVNRIIYRFRSPVIVNNIKSEIKIFAGIATYPSDDHNLDDLIKKCDISIFKDKSSERKQVIFYNDRISQEIEYQAQVSEQLSQALEKKEIYLKYQPLIDDRSEIYGFEALARWSSPVLGNISPGVFISNAEENYLIIPIGNWILEEACKMQVALREKFNREFMMSVNVSLIQILQNDYVDIVKDIIKKTDINPEYLTLELTESIFINSTIALDDKIDELHRMGVKFSLDDFGTGYASLTYLRNIAFDNLKIDKSFIDGILDARKENKIVGTIVTLVHNLDMKVIAEGVEQKSQYEYLKQISTDIFQGFFLSKPLTVEQLIDFVSHFYKTSKNRRIELLSKNKM